MRLEELTQEKNSSSKLVPSLFNERNLIRNSSPLTEYYDEYENELYNNSSQMDEMTHELMEDMDDMQRMMYSMKPRCFSMCEPTELFFRQVLPQILLFNQKVSFGDRFFVDFTGIAFVKSGFVWEWKYYALTWIVSFNSTMFAFLVVFHLLY